MSKEDVEKFIKLNTDDYKKSRKKNNKIYSKNLKYSGKFSFYNKSDYCKSQAIRACGENIRYIYNPSEKMQLEAISDDWDHLRYIKNPTYKVKLYAVRKSGRALDLIKNPDERLIIEAIINDYTEAYDLLDDPSDDIKWALILTSPWMFCEIKNPTEEMIEHAVKTYGKNIKYVKNKTKELIEFAIKNDPDALKYIENPSEEIQLLAVGVNWEAINHIKNLSDKVILRALKSEGVRNFDLLIYLDKISDNVLDIIMKKYYVLVEPYLDHLMNIATEEQKKKIISYTDIKDILD